MAELVSSTRRILQAFLNESDSLDFTDWRVTGRLLVKAKAQFSPSEYHEVVCNINTDLLSSAVLVALAVAKFAPLPINAKYYSPITEVLAIQWDGTEAAIEIIKMGTFESLVTASLHTTPYKAPTWRIHTATGTEQVNPGDYIVLDKGEYYVMAEFEFTAMYKESNNG